MKMNLYTSEFVSGGHPDKASDRVSDACLDQLLTIAVENGYHGSVCRCAVETLMKGNLVVVSGEIAAPEDVLAKFSVDEAVFTAWEKAGYRHQGPPVVLNYVKPQSAEIASLVDGEGVGAGAGDQGIMCGFAYRNGATYMPPEYEFSRGLIERLDELRLSGELPYLRSDAKSQVSLDADGVPHAIVISTQHSDEVSLAELREQVMERVVVPVVGDVSDEIVKINFKGSFVLGGSAADCGLTGRKIVVDQYGPRTFVGGGAFSGKDATKVDRSAAYMARLIAKNALVKAFPDSTSVSLQIAYGIGQLQPSSVLATLDCGTDISGWVHDNYEDLSPGSIQSALGLWDRNGWSYSDTAAMGHFGRDCFPWEKLSD